MYDGRRLRVQLVRPDVEQGVHRFQARRCARTLTRTLIIRRGVTCYPVVNPVLGQRMSKTPPECIGNVPNTCGQEDLIRESLARTDARPSSAGRSDFARIHSAFGIALHVHQPLIPAGGDELRTAKSSEF